MSSNIDMTLDDIIKTNKVGGGRGGSRRGRFGGSRSTGPVRNAPNRLGPRSTPYSITKPTRRAAAATTADDTWQHDMFEDTLNVRGKPAGIETGTKLYISNLDYGVSNEDIKELFSEVGDLKRCSINYDRSARSKGTAEVVFARKADALNALKRYNNVQLDGKPMKIDLIGTNLVTAVTNGGTPSAGRAAIAAAVASVRGRAARNGFGGGKRVGGGGGGGGRSGRGRGGGRGGRGGRSGGGGGGAAVLSQKSAQELDAELEVYHAEAMQT